MWANYSGAEFVRMLSKSTRKKENPPMYAHVLHPKSLEFRQNGKEIFLKV